MTNQIWQSRIVPLARVFFLVLSAGCGQADLTLPKTDGGVGDVCGAWYPGEVADTSDGFGFKEDQTLPCVVFRSARLDEEDTYINWTDMYLDAAAGRTDKHSIALVIGADNCPACAVFIRDLAENADRIDAAGAILINVTFCDNIDRTDCDFDLERAVAVATAEDWPLDRWYVTNDEDDIVSELYRDSFPTVIVARLSDMRVVSVDRVPRFEDFVNLLETL